MTALLAVDGFALLFFVLGFHLAFRQGLVRRLWSKGRSDAGSDAGPEAEDVASALRIGGVMLMAFSMTICVFANLIAYYSATGMNAVS
jgi:hypothetical protein